MKRVFALLILCGLVCLAETRRDVLTRLSNHLDAALGRAKVSDKDRKKLDVARQVVRDEADVKGRLLRTDRQDLHNALNDIKKRAKHFQEEDRRLVLDDLSRAHDLGLDRAPGAQRARAPRYPRYPRRWP